MAIDFKNRSRPIASHDRFFFTAYVQGDSRKFDNCNNYCSIFQVWFFFFLRLTATKNRCGFYFSYFISTKHRNIYISLKLLFFFVFKFKIEIL